MTEFVYRYSRTDRAHVFLSFILNTPSRETEVSQVITDLRKEGMTACDISDDELAKAHGRYMVGGCQDVEHERIFRFGQSESDSNCDVLIAGPRISRAPRSIAAIPAGTTLGLEYLSVSLSESRGWYAVLMVSVLFC